MIDDLDSFEVTLSDRTYFEISRFAEAVGCTPEEFLEVLIQDWLDRGRPDLREGRD